MCSYPVKGRRPGSRELKPQRSNDFVFDLNGTKVLVKAKWRVFNDLGGEMVCQGEICQAVALAKTHPSLLQRNFQPVIDLTGLNFTENGPQSTGTMTFF